MKFETVEIEDLATAEGVVPATLHYFEDQQVHLRIIDESPSLPNESGLREVLEKIREISREGSISLPSMLKDFQRIDLLCAEALAQYSSPSLPEPEQQEETENELLSKCLNMLRYFYMNEYCGEHAAEVWELIKAKK